MTATVGDVSPNPKRVLSDSERERIRAALTRRELAERELRAAVVESAASVRVLADFTGLSTSTVQRWKNDNV